MWIQSEILSLERSPLNDLMCNALLEEEGVGQEPSIYQSRAMSDRFYKTKLNQLNWDDDDLAGRL